mmetsp:Transcript_167109/g.536707  ORF Transcript_167109/g.536707 Transcript_167109/m.536707 type:complete len:789 (-) Transcript_167109:28-2394(-)
MAAEQQQQPQTLLPEMPQPATERRRLKGKQSPPEVVKRRRLTGKQPPPPEGLEDAYEATRARVEHIEAFGGVYGKVWVARDRAGQRRWLKQVKSHSWQDGLPEHGVREVAILKDLAASGPMPHIMAVADVLTPREAASRCHRLHIVAEHASHDLVSYVKTREIGPEAVRSMAWQLVLAVDFLHSRGVLHRNFKPASILVALGERLVVSGFETAIRCPPEGEQPHAGAFILRTHIAVRAPELLLGLNRDHQGMDIWALGCCVAFLTIRASVFSPEDNNDEAACREIFARLGVPGPDHILRGLPRFADLDLDLLKLGRCAKPIGLVDATPKLGSHGTDLLERMLDLDYCRRTTSQAALHHSYFAEAGLRPPASEGAGGVAALQLSTFSSSQASPSGGTPAVLSAPSRAARQYLLRDLRREREHQAWCTVALLALQQPLCKISGLAQHVWSFLFRPRHPRPDYVINLAYIREWMRAVLVDWLVEVHWKWRLQPAALQLATNLIDCYLARTPSLPTQRFQLLGVAALFLATKIEDEHYDTEMSATSLAWLTDRAYTPTEVLDMEASLATSIGFEAPSWGPYSFLSHYATIAPLPRRYFFVAQCYLEQSLLIYRLSRHSPSLIAGACYYLAAQLAAIAPPEAQQQAEEEARSSSGDRPATSTVPEEGTVPQSSSIQVLDEGAPRSLIDDAQSGEVVEKAQSERAAAEGEDRTASAPSGAELRPRTSLPEALVAVCGRSEEQVRRCAAEVAEAVRTFDVRGKSGKPLVAVRDKFGYPVHLWASELVWPTAEAPA